MFRINHKFILFVLLIVLLVVPLAALAQDSGSTSVPTGVNPAFTPPEFPDVLATLEKALVALFAAAIASPVTSPLVSLIKRIPQLKRPDGTYRISADTLNLAVAIALSAIFYGAQAVGFREQVNTAFKLLAVLLPIFVGAGANYVSNQAVYKALKGMPVAGYQRVGTTSENMKGQNRVITERWIRHSYDQPQAAGWTGWYEDEGGNLKAFIALNDDVILWNVIG